MSRPYAIQSCLHESLGGLHVNIPTHSSRTHGNQQAPDPVLCETEKQNWVGKTLS
jgi:hypothetical protein